MTTPLPRDARGRYLRRKPPDYVVEFDERGHLRSVHGQGWRFEAERRVRPWLWFCLGLAVGWLLWAITFAQVNR